MNRKLLIVGSVILTVFMILVLSGSIILLRGWNGRGAQIGQREPLPGLSYCSSNQVRPCVLSFNLDSHENLVINILTDHSSPDFYLEIRQDERESSYECQKVAGFSTRVSCTGKTMPVGEALQFTMISIKEDILLAEGSFPIIGLALATPDIAITPTFIPSFNHRPPK